MHLFPKRLLLVILMPSLLVLMTSCGGSKHSNHKRMPGTWQESAVTIDGSNKDWPSPYPEYDSKSMLGYCVSNDKDNLYITVETGDLATQLKILQNGLTVWIDKTGNKEEIIGINFPLPYEYAHKDKVKGELNNDKREEHSYTGQNNTHPDNWKEKRRLAMEEKVKRMMKDVNAYSLQGFKACNFEFPLLERDTCGIVVRMAIDSDNEMVWEAVIPFKSFYSKKEISRIDKGKIMSVCFETTGSKKPAGQTGNSGHHSGGGGGGGFRPSIGMGGMGGMHMGMGGGGMRGGGRGGGQQNTQDTEMEQLYKSTKTYKVFGLAWIEKH